MRLILASASPARLGLLRAAGTDPVVRVSGVDEDAVAAALVDPAPAELVVELAMAKARAVVPAVAADFPAAVVVGCDSMLHVGDELVGKPGTGDAVTARWAGMAGGTGDLLTGHAVLRIEDGAVTATAAGCRRTIIRFARPSDAEVAAYVASGEPLQVAGGFTIDGLGGWFVEGVDGDPSSVVGISLPLTRELLARVGVPVVSLWSTGSPWCADRDQSVTQFGE